MSSEVLPIRWGWSGRNRPMTWSLLVGKAVEAG